MRHDEPRGDLPPAPAFSRRHLDSLVAPAVILLAAVLFFLPFFVEGKIFLAADTLYGFFPWRAYAPQDFRPHNTLITDPVNHNWTRLYNTQLKEGRLAGWNPYLMSGLPATGATAMSGMSGRYYPLKLLLHRLLDAPQALTLLLFTHVLFMGLAMLLFLRGVGAGPRGALFGALVYMFNGCAMVWLEFETQAAAFAVLPLILLCLERLRGSRPWGWALGGGLCLGLVMVMGHTQYLIYAGLMAGLYFLFVLGRALRAREGRPVILRLAGGFGVVCAVGLLVAGIEVLPLLELIRESGRIERGFTFRGFFDTLGRVPWRYYVTLVFPDYFGSPPLGINLIPSLPTQEYMNYCELTFTLGVPALFAALAAAVAARGAHARFFLGMAVLVAALMSGTFLYYPFFLLVPGMDKMNPTRLVWLFDFAFAAVAGLGVGALDDLPRRARTLFLGAGGALLAAIVVLGLTASSPAVVTWFHREILGSAAHAPGILPALQELRAVTSPVILGPLLAAVAAAGLFAWYVIAAHRLQRTAAFGLLLALVAWQGISFGRGFNTVVDPGYVYAPTPGIEFLRRQPGTFRVLGDTSRGLLHNTLAPFFLQEAGGYSSFSPGRTHRLASAVDFGAGVLQGARYDRWVGFRNLASPLLDLMNVRYVVTAPDRVLALAKFRAVYRGRDLSVYENLQVMPRAFAVSRPRVLPGGDAALALLLSPGFDARREVTLEEAPDPDFLRGVNPDAGPGRADIVSYAPDRVEIAADFASAGWLVLTDAWYPGWRAESDGREVPVLRADYAFRAVALPAGRHRVVFEFRPGSYSRGRWLTLLGVLVVAVGIAVSLRSARRRG